MTRQLNFAHPSYRDLVIDQLRNNQEARTAFLESAQLEGVQLAVSESGGATGDRALPLLLAHRDWELLEKRCRELVRESSADERGALLYALSQPRRLFAKRRLTGPKSTLLKAVLEECRAHWNDNDLPMSNGEIEAYLQASVAVRPLPSLPSFESTWLARVQSVEEWLKEDQTESSQEVDAFLEWVGLVSILQRCEPRFLLQQNFPESVVLLVERCLSWISGALSPGGCFEVTQRDDYVIDLLESLELRLTAASQWSPRLEKACGALASRVGAIVNESREEARQIEEDRVRELDREGWHGKEGGSSRRDADKLEIERIFSDL